MTDTKELNKIIKLIPELMQDKKAKDIKIEINKLLKEIDRIL